MSAATKPPRGSGALRGSARDAATAGNPASRPLTELRNLGPKSTAWLASIGVDTLADLEDIGSVAAYRRLKAAGYPVTLNLVWGIEATLRGLHWRDLPESVKAPLRKELGRA